MLKLFGKLAEIVSFIESYHRISPQKPYKRFINPTGISIMNKSILWLMVFAIIVLCMGCSTNKYISEAATNSGYFEGKWQFRDHTDRILMITKIEDNIFNLKFDSETNDWEGIGYQSDDELLGIFKYYDIEQKGYITFKLTEKDKINFMSLAPNGEFRSEGYFVRKIAY